MRLGCGFCSCNGVGGFSLGWTKIAGSASKAHVRGYQVRKYYKVCWAVSILEKVVLRWRRHGVGLRGFRPEIEPSEENEEEDILKVFRKRTMDPAIDEAASRVLALVESPEARQQYHRLLDKYRQAKFFIKGGSYGRSNS